MSSSLVTWIATAKSLSLNGKGNLIAMWNNPVFSSNYSIKLIEMIYGS